MSKHTPGPWRVRHSDTKKAFNVVGTRLGGNWKIARCPYSIYAFNGAEKRNLQEKEEAEANAKLIREAPQLLEGLQEAIGFINDNSAALMSSDTRTVDLFIKWAKTIQKATI